MAAGSFVTSDPDRFQRAIMLLDQANSEDPNRAEMDDQLQPRELVYSHWVSNWVARLCPEASEELRLAARAQHLRRWKNPRTNFPPTRAGYLQWREGQKKFHAQQAAEVLLQAGYPEGTVARVQDLISKRLFPKDPESRVLEDALCLVFLEHQLEELATRSTPDKMINAIQKTWKKMTPEGHRQALALSLSPGVKTLLDQALKG